MRATYLDVKYPGHWVYPWPTPRACGDVPKHITNMKPYYKDIEFWKRQPVLHGHFKRQSSTCKSSYRRSECSDPECNDCVYETITLREITRYKIEELKALEIDREYLANGYMMDFITHYNQILSSICKIFQMMDDGEKVHRSGSARVHQVMKVKEDAEAFITELGLEDTLARWKDSIL